jgi:hypothetical protein
VTTSNHQKAIVHVNSSRGEPRAFSVHGSANPGGRSWNKDSDFIFKGVQRPDAGFDYELDSNRIALSQHLHLQVVIEKDAQEMKITI